MYPFGPYKFGNPAATAGGVPAPSGPALVQQAVGTDASGSPSASFSPAAGNSVIMVISYLSTDVVDSDPRLTGGFTESLTLAIASTVVGVTVEIWYIHNIAGGHTGATFVGLEGTRCSLNVSEWSGLANSTPTDTSTNSGVAAAAVSTGSVDPIMPNNLVVGMYGSITDSYVSGPTGGFTALTSTGGTGAFQRAGYLVQSAATAANPGWTITSDNFAAAAVSFAGSEQSSALVAGAGTGAANGTYTYRGTRNGKPFYNLTGQPNNDNVSAIYWDTDGDGQWFINDSGASLLYASDITLAAFPWDSASWSAFGGSEPVPTVTEG